jgi:hypothetical protein
LDSSKQMASGGLKVSFLSKINATRVARKEGGGGNIAFFIACWTSRLEAKI